MKEKDEEYWLWAIKKRPQKVVKMINRLFENSKKTKEFLEAIIDLLPTIGKRESSPSEALIFVGLIREKFLQISEKQLFDCFSDEDPNATLNFVQLLCGAKAKEEEFERSKNVFAKLVGFVYRNPLPNIEDKKEALATLIPLEWISHLITISLLGITFTWQNLFTQVQKDLEAKKILKKLLRLSCLYGYGVNITKFSSLSVEEKSLQNFHQLRTRFFEGILFVPDELEMVVQAVYQELIREIKEEQKGLLDLLLWFSENFQDIENKYNAMWQEIKENPRYMLRPNGLDKVKLEITALQKSCGYYLLQFFPKEFPEASVKFWLKGEEDENWSLTMECKFAPLSEFKVRPEMENTDLRVMVDRFLLFVATECLWKIVCGKEKKEKMADRKSRFVKHSAGIVRAHLRHLPISFSASEEAKSAAQQFFGVLPPSGFTFVHEHLRGEAIVELTSNPLFAYSEEDLGYLVVDSFKPN